MTDLTEIEDEDFAAYGWPWVQRLRLPDPEEVESPEVGLDELRCFADELEELAGLVEDEIQRREEAADAEAIGQEVSAYLASLEGGQK